MTTTELREEWQAAVGDAGVDPQTLVLFIVPQPQPDGGAEAAYLAPSHLLRGDSQLVLHRVGNEPIGRYHAQHKIAAWQHPRHEDERLAAALVLRHELHHVVQFEAGGFDLIELYEDLKEALRDRYDATWLDWYFEMPPERDANAAAAAYARERYPERFAARADDPALWQFFTELPPPNEATLPERTISALIEHARPDIVIDGRSLDELVAARVTGIEAWPPGGVEFMREQYRREPEDEGVLVVTPRPER
jgi:hypothetical protein